MTRNGRVYSVYIVMSSSGTLYTGIPGNLHQRIWMHKTLKFQGFSSRYRCTKLVYCWQCSYVLNAIRREKQIKGWRRSKKLDLIERFNPGYLDLAEGWYEQDPSRVEGDIEFLNA